MKILAVSARYPTSLQTWFINYLQAVENAGASVQVLSMDTGEENYHPKVDQIGCQRVLTYRIQLVTDLLRTLVFALFSGKLASLFSVCRQLRRDGFTWKELLQGARGLHLYSKVDADIIHCHSEKAGFRVLPLLCLLDKPVVLTFHGLPPQGVPDIQAKQRQILARHVSLLLVNTRFAADQYANLVEHQLPIHIIKQCISLDDFPYEPRPFPGEKGSVKLLTVGRIDRLKGHKLVLDAIASLHDKGYELHYTIVGAGYYVPELERYTVENGVRHLVSIDPPALGASLLHYFQSHDLFILPSFTESGQWAETQGIVVQEAQACGLPVIASDSGGIPECVSHTNDALLFKQGAAVSLAAALERLLGSESLWNHLVATGRSNVENRYSLHSMGDDLIRAYKSIPRSTPPQ